MSGNTFWANIIISKYNFYPQSFCLIYSKLVSTSIIWEYNTPNRLLVVILHIRGFFWRLWFHANGLIQNFQKVSSDFRYKHLRWKTCNCGIKFGQLFYQLSFYGTARVVLSLTQFLPKLYPDWLHSGIGFPVLDLFLDNLAPIFTDIEQQRLTLKISCLSRILIADWGPIYLSMLRPRQSQSQNSTTIQTNV